MVAVCVPKTTSMLVRLRVGTRGRFRRDGLVDVWRGVRSDHFQVAGGRARKGAAAASDRWVWCRL
jgi:hypothetical protein